MALSWESTRHRRAAMLTGKLAGLVQKKQDADPDKRDNVSRAIDVVLEHLWSTLPPARRKELNAAHCGDYGLP